MNLYWLYNLSSFLLGTLIVGFFTLIGIAGLFLTRGWVRRLHLIDHSHNDIVGFYLASITLFYGITLGLVAVGTWETYADAQNRVDREAEAMGALYRDISGYPEPVRTLMQNELRSYIRQLIDVAWPMQQRGIVLNVASGTLADFQNQLMSFEPSTERQKILATEALHAFNEFTETRRARLNSVTAEMPGPIWIIVIVGALVSIATTWLFHTASFGMHFWLTVLLSVLIGLLVYMIVSLDNPYRGRISVNPDAMQRVYEQTMLPQP